MRFVLCLREDMHKPAETLSELKERCLKAAANGYRIGRAAVYVASLQKKVGGKPRLGAIRPESPEHILLLIGMVERGERVQPPVVQMAPKTLPSPAPVPPSAPVAPPPEAKAPPMPEPLPEPVAEVKAPEVKAVEPEQPAPKRGRPRKEKSAVETSKEVVAVETPKADFEKE